MAFCSLLSASTELRFGSVATSESAEIPRPSSSSSCLHPSHRNMLNIFNPSLSLKLVIPEVGCSRPFTALKLEASPPGDSPRNVKTTR